MLDLFFIHYPIYFKKSRHKTVCVPLNFSNKKIGEYCKVYISIFQKFQSYFIIYIIKYIFRKSKTKIIKYNKKWKQNSKAEWQIIFLEKQPKWINFELLKIVNVEKQYLKFFKNWKYIYIKDSNNKLWILVFNKKKGFFFWIVLKVNA